MTEKKHKGRECGLKQLLFITWVNEAVLDFHHGHIEGDENEDVNNKRLVCNFLVGIVF